MDELAAERMAMLYDEQFREQVDRRAEFFNVNWGFTK